MRDEEARTWDNRAQRRDYSTGTMGFLKVGAVTRPRMGLLVQIAECRLGNKARWLATCP
jgi:hypothetical protein